MSSIKKALERAKLERQAPESLSRMMPGPVLERASEGGFSHAGAEQPIVFTKTRVFETPPRDLLRNRLVCMDETHPATERFKLLRTQIFQRTRSKGWNTIQISSFGNAEGKSMIAANLAISIARDARQTTLLVELDFKNPSLHKLLGLGEPSPGLKSYFLEDAPLEQCFLSPGIQKLSVLTAGGKIAHSAEILGSPKMEALVRELKERYDDRYIILDTPGISVCPDPLIISEYVDALLLVARVNHTTQKSIRAAMERVPKEKLLGVVLNSVPPEDMSSY